MSIGEHLLDLDIQSVNGAWSERDCRIYALGVGAGMGDPAQELDYTTENSEGKNLRVLPTFGLIQGCKAGIASALAHLEDVDLARMLHGEQRIEQHRELPTSARVKTNARFTAVWDKGNSGAVVETRSCVRDAQTDELYATCDQSLFFRGYGGWGGARGPQSSRSIDDRGAPKTEFTIRTRPDQPLLYRLSGDDNPLHSDPAFARRAGFSRPIMHGLCVFGSVGREMVRRFADGDPARFKAMGARFSSPTMPGDDLNVSVWQKNELLSFDVKNQEGKLLLSEGTLELK